METPHSPAKYEVDFSRVRRECDPATLPFEQTTDELPPLSGIIRQPRFLEGHDMGLTVGDKSYNIRAIVSGGTSRNSALVRHTREFVNANFTGSPVYDLCYVFCFSDYFRPKPILLPRGEGKELKAVMERVRKAMGKSMRLAFSGWRLDQRLRAPERLVEELVRERQTELDGEIGQRLGVRFSENINWRGTEFFLLPVVEVGYTQAHAGAPAKLVVPEGIELEMLQQIKAQTPSGAEDPYYVLDISYIEKWFENRGVAEDKRRAFFNRILAVGQEIQEAYETLSEERARINKETAGEVIDKVLGVERAEERFPAAAEYLRGLKEFFLVQYPAFFLGKDGMEPVMVMTDTMNNLMSVFDVHVAVDQTDLQDAAPIVYAADPTFRKMFGEIGQQGGTQLPNGAYIMGMPDHRCLKPGYVLEANGGVLIIPLQVQDLLMNADTLDMWQVLTQAIESGEVTIEDVRDRGRTSQVSRTMEVKPRPVPLNLKVILILNHELDHLFSVSPLLRKGYELFRARAEFVTHAERTPDTEKELAQFLGDCSRKENLLHCDTTGVAALIEYASWLAGDQRNLSLLFGEIKDVLLQADYWAKADTGATQAITDKHVRHALEQRIYRAGVIRENMLELQRDGILKIEVAGERAGFVNGLWVYTQPEISFGMPFRITATVWPGRFYGIVDVERKILMSGPIQQKSVEIVSGFFADRFGDKAPLSVTMQLVFEQAYSGVEGDSASLAEFIAPMTKLANIPVKQYIAVTGSCNQAGDTHAIGGVNQKIEGFFNACKAVGGGLSGEQGVIIPKDNLSQLMLREEVAEAIGKRQFHIWAVGHVDEAIAILTGVEAGEWDEEKKQYPERSVNGLVLERLHEFARLSKKWKDLGGDGADDGTGGQEDHPTDS